MPASKENDNGAKALSAPPDPFQDEQTVLILVGLIASGKVELATSFGHCIVDDRPLYSTIIIVYFRRGS